MIDHTETFSLQKWDAALKVLAEGYAAKCVWNHNPDLEDTGENLFVSTGPMDLREGMEKWFLGECAVTVKSPIVSQLPESHAGLCWVTSFFQVVFHSEANKVPPISVVSESGRGGIFFTQIKASILSHKLCSCSLRGCMLMPHLET